MDWITLPGSVNYGRMHPKDRTAVTEEPKLSLGAERDYESGIWIGALSGFHQHPDTAHRQGADFCQRWRAPAHRNDFPPDWLRRAHCGGETGRPPAGAYPKRRPPVDGL